MTFSSAKTPDLTQEWRALSEHRLDIGEQSLRDAFEQDPQRAQRFSLQCGDLFLDYSKNRITDNTVSLLIDLAKAQGVESLRDKMFAGEKINHTENRAVLHSALRNRGHKPVMLDGQDVMQEVHAQLDKMRMFTDAVRSGDWTGATGKKISHIINIGIGGSDLGPLMVCEALKSQADTDLTVKFVSNVDGAHITDALQGCAYDTTLFVVSSKSFTTQETRLNTEAALQWFHGQGADKKAVAQHFVSVTTNLEAAAACGIPAENCFTIWDWVGGRYSLWSAIGLPIALMLGMKQFEALLDGAYEMDQHFQQAPLEKNMPVLLAMLGVWYRNFFDYSSHAVLPYDQRLQYFPAYLQQLDMESNGKSCDRHGNKVSYATGPIVWGTAGTNGQHAYFQLLHQGTSVVPADFILAAKGDDDLTSQHSVLLNNALAQMEALMRGKTEHEAQQELAAAGLSVSEQKKLSAYKVFVGNRPSNAIVMPRLTPHNLGMLIALYEHKVFVQGVIWDINSFDQWGVEYGKQLANQLLASEQTEHNDFCSSTQALLDKIERESKEV